MIISFGLRMEEISKTKTKKKNIGMAIDGNDYNSFESSL